jgi:hypothetical protein
MNVVSLIKYAFTLVGIAMLTGAFYAYKSTKTFLQTATKTEGTVVELIRSRSDGSDTFKPVVHFVDQKGETIEFTSSTSSNPPSYSVEEKVGIWYDPAKPQHAEIDGFFSLWGITTIFGGLGAIFFLVGAGIIFGTAFKRRRDESLRTRGTPIETDLQSVQLNTSFEVNGKHPYKVLTQWFNPFTSEVHVFESDNVWFDPASYLKDRKITVFIENDNPKKYLVDLSFLPKLAK